MTKDYITNYEAPIEDIRELMKLSGAGMYDCKRALNATYGDIDLATEFLKYIGTFGGHLDKIVEKAEQQHLARFRRSLDEIKRRKIIKRAETEMRDMDLKTLERLDAWLDINTGE